MAMITATRRSATRIPQRPITPINVAYLFGAGSTQAELDFMGGAAINLLMRDIDSREGVSTRILNRLTQKERKKVKTEGQVDIEKLISLLASNGVGTSRELADKIRRCYYDEVTQSLTKTNLLPNPPLAQALAAPRSPGKLLSVT